MPNTIPQTLTRKLHSENKYWIKFIFGKFFFFFMLQMKILEEVLKVNFKHTPGVKIFMGSSTGNMLVDDYKVLNLFFLNAHH